LQSQKSEDREDSKRLSYGKIGGRKEKSHKATGYKKCGRKREKRFKNEGVKVRKGQIWEVG